MDHMNFLNNEYHIYIVLILFAREYKRDVKDKHIVTLKVIVNL